MADKQVSILKRDGTQSTFYSTYTSAIADAVSDDVIQIWADLTEQITLKNGVDIWIMPGVKIDSGSSSTTIVAPTTGTLNCSIYGQGIIKNESSGNCIFIDNVNANLRIECDTIEGTGGGTTSVSLKIKTANKFHITCNKVYNESWQAIGIGDFSPGLVVNDINLKISHVETGNITASSPFKGTTAIITRGDGFLRINEVLVRNAGHCLSHREGNITARINKLTSINNSTSYPAAVHVRQYSGNSDTGNQKLILYFDEIQALTGVVTTNFSCAGVEIGEGTGIFIGRKVYSRDNPAFQIVGANTKGNIKCNEIISQGRADSTPVSAMNLSNTTNQITVNANYIQGYRDSGVIFINDANVQIKNAKLVNTYTGTSVSSLGIFIAGTKVIILINVQIVIGELSNGRSIYHTGSTEPDTFDLKNYGLFVNKAIDSNMKLLIGTKLGTGYNYQYIIDPLLT